MIDSAGSTSSMRTGCVAWRKSIRPRSVQSCFDWSSISAVYSWNTL